MPLIELVTLLALFEYFGFALAVAGARQRFGVKAPATSGHEHFERYFRVQQNTLELLVMFIPSLWIAARYFPAWLVTAVGAVYLVGRLLYFRGYVAEAGRRHLGFMLSIVPVLSLAGAAAIGAALALFGWRF
jgi:glutathione S-transferase